MERSGGGDGVAFGAGIDVAVVFFENDLSIFCNKHTAIETGAPQGRVQVVIDHSPLIVQFIGRQNSRS